VHHAQPLRLLRLLGRTLEGAQVLHHRGQQLVSMIAKLNRGHRDGGYRHEDASKGFELIDDLPLVHTNEVDQGHIKSSPTRVAGR
jgi:hypothetical protein